MKQSVREKYRRIRVFMNRDVWNMELSSLTSLRRLGVKSLRVVHLVFKGFREDDCPLHASALTFNTLMAIVPILALSLALARVFGGADLAERRIRGALSEFTSQFETHTVERVEAPAVGEGLAPKLRGSDAGVMRPEDLAVKLNEILDAGLEQVGEINFAALGSLGLILLLWMVVTVLSRVEASFNRVWGVSVGRPMFRRFSDYLFMVIILPFLITMASSLSIAEFVAQFMDDENAARLGAILDSPALGKLTTLLLTVATFTVLIKFMPNTKVRLRPALAGGIVVALLFVTWLWACATIQTGVVKYSKFYGGFAIVPIVFAWVYVSWEIVLFGAEVAFAVQNCTTYRMEQGANRANVHARIALALTVVVECARVMIGERERFEAGEYAKERRIPVRFLNDIIDELVQAGMLGRLSDGDNTVVLLKAPTELCVRDVYDVIMQSGVKPDDLGMAAIDKQVLTAADKVTNSGRVSDELKINGLLGSG